MKKTLILTVLLLMTLVVSAQVINNPSQSSNSRMVKVTKVERKADCTLLHLKFTNPGNYTSNLAPYPTLTDESTGKKYYAQAARNFNWRTKYDGDYTYIIEFPALPKNVSKVTFREVEGTQNPWVIKNIAIGTQGNRSTTGNGQTANRPQTSNEYQQTFENPSQRPTDKFFRVTKVIRSNKSTIVHFVYDGYSASRDIEFDHLRYFQLIDDDTERKFNATKALNFETFTKYRGKHIYKIQFPPLPKNVSVVRFYYPGYEVKDIRIPLRTKKPAPQNNNGRTVIINVN